MDMTNSASVQEISSQVTSLNAKSDLHGAFNAANNAAKGYLSSLTKTDKALYHALQLIYEFVIAGESRPEEFEEFKRAKGIKRSHNAKSIFQPYVKYFISKNTDAKEIIGRASKYGAVLDEAVEQEINPEQLSKWLKDQGIENICKERRRRYKEQKPKPASTLDAVVDATDAEPPGTAIPSRHAEEIISDDTIRHVLELSAQAKECDDSEERRRIHATLDQIASPLKIDGQALVLIAEEENITREPIRKWGDDERAREIGRLRLILHRHGIPYHTPLMMRL